ncbi:MAG: lipocalin family protein [Alistipes sp.]|nr:lipocalin family protein [Alistipes sp.]
MKSLKIFSLVMLLAVALTGCKKSNNADGPNVGGGSDDAVLSGEWVLTSWNEAEPEFNVYIAFNEDNTFEMYQQVWSFDYEYFAGNYTITDDIVTGTYTDGSNWHCGYKFLCEGDSLTLYSQEDTSVVSLYTRCEIPAEIKEEATTTRSTDVVPFL